WPIGEFRLETVSTGAGSRCAQPAPARRPKGRSKLHGPSMLVHTLAMPQRSGSHRPDRIIDFPQWKKASRTSTIIARPGALQMTVIFASRSGSRAKEAVPLTRTTSRRLGTMNTIHPRDGFRAGRVSLAYVCQ